MVDSRIEPPNPLRSLLALALLLSCRSSRDVSPSPSTATAPPVEPHTATSGAAAPSPAASASTECAELAGKIAAVETSHAKEAFACTTAADCECYGGPVCPNALATQCPRAVGASVARELVPLVSAWTRAECGGFLWSPYGCDAACVDGRCASARR